jgi:hypothetical protein
MKNDELLRTTVNIEKSRLDKLNNAVNEYGISKVLLIHLVVEKYVEYANKSDFHETTIQYQKKGFEYHKVHFELEPESYDVFFDLKKVLRCSFSLIVALAIDMFLETIMEPDSKNSYPEFHVEKNCIVENNFTKYMFMWINKKNFVQRE